MRIYFTRVDDDPDGRSHWLHIERGAGRLLRRVTSRGHSRTHAVTQLVWFAWAFARRLFRAA